MAFRAAHEWRTSVPIYMFVGDVLQAFDNVSPLMMAWGMEQAGAHETLIAAVLEECVDLKATVSFEDIEVECGYNRLRQGSKEAPPTFRDLICALVSPLVSVWKRRTPPCGYSLEHFWLTHLIWADNIYLFASSEFTLHQMVWDVTDVLERAGLRWKKKSLEILATLDLERPFRISVADDEFGGRQSMIVPEKDEIIALGCKVNRKGSSMAAAEHRISIAEKKYWASKKEYGDDVPMDVRMQRFAQRLIPVVLHCSDGWTWHQRLALKIRSWESKMLRRITRIFKKNDEDFVTWHRRAVAIGRQWFEERLGYDTTTVRLLRKIHVLTGTVAVLPLRLGDPPPTLHTNKYYFLPAAVHYKSTRWWWTFRAEREAEDNGWQCHGDWRHGTPGAPCQRFDNVHCHYGGENDWLLKVLDGTWTQNFVSFAVSAFNFANMDLPFCLREKPATPAIAKSEAEPRTEDEFRIEPPWTQRSHLIHANGIGSTTFSLCIFGDSMQVVRWINGHWKMKNKKIIGRVGWMQQCLSQALHDKRCTPASLGGDWALHIYREQNKSADFYANVGHAIGIMGRDHVVLHRTDALQTFWPYICGCWDGSFKDSGGGGCGFSIFGALFCNSDGRPAWLKLLSFGGFISRGKNATNCELKACMTMIWAIRSLFVQRNEHALVALPKVLAEMENDENFP